MARQDRYAQARVGFRQLYRWAWLGKVPDPWRVLTPGQRQELKDLRKLFRQGHLSWPSCRPHAKALLGCRTRLPSWLKATGTYHDAAVAFLLTHVVNFVEPQHWVRECAPIYRADLLFHRAGPPTAEGFLTWMARKLTDAPTIMRYYEDAVRQEFPSVALVQQQTA